MAAFCASATTRVHIYRGLEVTIRLVFMAICICIHRVTSYSCFFFRYIGPNSVTSVIHDFDVILDDHLKVTSQLKCIKI